MQIFGQHMQFVWMEAKPMKNPLPISRGNKVPDPGPRKVGRKGITDDPGPDDEEIPPLILGTPQEINHLNQPFFGKYVGFQE